MRQRHQHAREISHTSCTSDECGQVIRLDSKRDANRVCTLFDKESVQQFGRLGCRQWITHQAIESRCSCDMRGGMHCGAMMEGAANRHWRGEVGEFTLCGSDGSR